METLTKYEIKEIKWPERTFLIKRGRISFDKLTSFFGESYGAIYDAIEKLHIESYEPPCAIYYSIDEDNYETDLAAAVPVHGHIPANTFGKLTIPPSKVLVITYHGSYDNMGPAYIQLEKYAKDHNLKKEWMIEEYLSSPSIESDPRKLITNIYFVVK